MQDSKQYNAIAKQYSDLFIEENQLSITAYFKNVDFDVKNKKILDLGFGDGYDLSLLGEQGGLLYGVDASEAMVNLARERNPHAELKLGFFENIPYPDQYFDIIMSKWAIQTSAEIEPIYKEVARVLKPGGIFLFLVSHPIRQFLEKKKSPKDYFQKEMVDSVIFKNKIVVRDPSHTMNEYLSSYFLRHFDLIAYDEGFDNSAEKINGDTYPIFSIFKAIKR
jgi:ubiquinone/menaquinone biosynthesis C-methylase UbiE